MEYQPKKKNNNKKILTKTNLKNIQETENIIVKEADKRSAVLI